MPYFFRLLICLVFLGLPLHAQADDRTDDSLTIASFPFPPLFHTAHDQSFSGTMGETVKKICELGQVKCNFIILPPKRTYQYLEQGKVDALATIDLNQFKKCCVKSDWNSPWSAGFFLNERHFDAPDSEDDLLGSSLIIVKGMKSPFSFMPNLAKHENLQQIKVIRANSIWGAAKMLTLGRAPYMWGGEDFSWYLDKISPDHPYSFIGKKHYSVVVWARQEKAHLLRKLNAGFKRAQEQGLLSPKNLLNDELMKKLYIDAPFDQN